MCIMFLPSGAFMSKEITKKKVSNDSYSVVVCLPVGGPLLTRDRGFFFYVIQKYLSDEFTMVLPSNSFAPT